MRRLNFFIMNRKEKARDRGEEERQEQEEVGEGVRDMSSPALAKDRPQRSASDRSYFLTFPESPPDPGRTFGGGDGDTLYLS